MRSAAEWAAGWTRDTITLGDVAVEIATNSLTAIIQQAINEAAADMRERAASEAREHSKDWMVYAGPGFELTRAKAEACRELETSIRALPPEKPQG